jgi:hypothetical protein
LVKAYGDYNSQVVFCTEIVSFHAEKFSPFGHSLMHPFAVLSGDCSKKTTAAPPNALQMSASNV